MALPARVDGLPRRIRIDRNAHPELAIRYAIDAVEHLGADPRLTEAVTLLAEAREKVADFLEDPACGYACEWHAIYGWVPQAGCPKHD